MQPSQQSTKTWPDKSYELYPNFNRNRMMIMFWYWKTHVTIWVQNFLRHSPNKSVHDKLTLTTCYIADTLPYDSTHIAQGWQTRNYFRHVNFLAAKRSTRSRKQCGKIKTCATESVSSSVENPRKNTGL